MNRVAALLCALPLAVAVALASVVAAATIAGGTWQRLPASPIAPNEGLASVWTGKQMLVFGNEVTRAKDGAVLKRVAVAAAYDPTTHTWQQLTPTGSPSDLGDYGAVWTGREMLVWGQGSHEAYNPATKQWRTFPSSKLLSVHDAHGLVAWTGREMIGWGGGCCGDAFSDGVAYSPTTNAWHALARAPLAGSQHPIGAWTGRELVVFVGNFDPNGKPWPARFARAAAYKPARNAWTRIASPPGNVSGATAVWDGRDVLVVGAGDGRTALAYTPATNTWRKLARMPSRRTQPAAVWTGRQLLLWGGNAGQNPVRSGLAYTLPTNRWSTFAGSPLAARIGATAVWTGRTMIVLGGNAPKKPSGTRYFTDGAAYTP